MNSFILTYESRKLSHVVIFNTELTRSQVKKFLEDKKSKDKNIDGQLIYLRRKEKKSGVVRYMEYLDPKTTFYTYVEGALHGSVKGAYRDALSRKMRQGIKRYCLRNFDDSAFMLLFECADEKQLDDILFNYEFEEENL